MNKLLHKDNLLYVRNMIKSVLFRICFLAIWLSILPFIWNQYKSINIKIYNDHFSSLNKSIFENTTTYLHNDFRIVVTIVTILLFIIIFTYIFLTLIYIIQHKLLKQQPKYKIASQCALLKARTNLLHILQKLHTVLLYCLLLVFIIAPIPFYLYIYWHPSISIIEDFSTHPLSVIWFLIIYTRIEAAFPVLYVSVPLLLTSSDYNHQMKLHLNTHTPLAYSFNSILGINFDHLDGYHFEQYCATLLNKIGYEHIKITPKGHDQGVDIIAFKKGIKYAIQCKRYNNTVGNKAIQEIVAGKVYYQCQEGIVITNNYFTKSAKALAQANNIILWDRQELIKILHEAALIPD